MSPSPAVVDEPIATILIAPTPARWPDNRCIPWRNGSGCAGMTMTGRSLGMDTDPGGSQIIQSATQQTLAGKYDNCITAGAAKSRKFWANSSETGQSFWL